MSYEMIGGHTAAIEHVANELACSANSHRFDCFLVRL